jgi:hypothetical protein
MTTWIRSVQDISGYIYLHNLEVSYKKDRRFLRFSNEPVYRRFIFCPASKLCFDHGFPRRRDFVKRHFR